MSAEVNALFEAGSGVCAWNFMKKSTMWGDLDRWTQRSSMVSGGNL